VAVATTKPKKRHKVTPEQRPYEPRGAALDLWRCRELEVLIEGPAGTGKRRAALEKLYACAHKYPGMRGLIVRKTRSSASESVLVTFEGKVVPANHPCLRGTQRRFRSVYEFANGSTIVVGGMDRAGNDHAARIMSSEYDMICAFEATEFSQDDWERLLTRLRNNKMAYHQIIADCNPAAPSHWLNVRANDGGMARLLSRHQDNPLLHKSTGEATKAGAAYIVNLGRLSGLRRMRLLEGRWAAAEGLVYDEFDPAVHLIDSFEIPQDWTRIRSIDFGYTNPFVCQWWALDGDGRMYLYRELYGAGRLVSEWAREIKSYPDHVVTTVADHDAEDRATLAAEGIHTIPARKAISSGIEAVKRRLAVAGDGRPRLFVLRDVLVSRDEALHEAGKPCCTAEEIEGYVWPKGQDGKPNKEAPVKDDDHGMDTLRYAVAHVDGLGQTPLRARVVNVANRHRHRRNRMWSVV